MATPSHLKETDYHAALKLFSVEGKLASDGRVALAWIVKASLELCKLSMLQDLIEFE
jgi:hypothetical protein